MPKPFRILMTADAVGGIWTYALTLAQGIQQAIPEAEVRLVCIGRFPSADQRRQAFAARVQLHSMSGKLEWMSDPWQDLALQGPALLQQVRNYQPHVIHLNHYAHTALPWRTYVPDAAIIQGVHSCINTWWQGVYGTDAPTDTYARYTRMVADALHAADAVLIPTLALAQAMEQTYGPIPRRHIVPNAVDVDRWQPLDKVPTVMAVGRLWDEAKNLQLLAEAAPGLPAPVCLAGDARDPETGAITPLPNVQVMGQLSQDELAVALGRAAIFASPARYEPFGLAVAEAAAAGCALVLADIPTFRELWEGAALFLPPNDPTLWRQFLANLLADPRACAHWGQLARIRVQRYSISACVRRTLRTYPSLRVSPFTVNTAAA